MRHNEAFLFTLKASAVNQILDKIPNNCSAKREAVLQVDKLNRMVNDFRKRFKFQNVLTTASNTKSLNKQIGKAIHGLGLQSRKVTEWLNKAIEQDFFDNNPEISARTSKKLFRASIAEANHKFEQTIYEATVEFRGKILEVYSEGKQLK